MGKIITLEEAIKVSKEARNNNKKVGLITGCFDILHIGHIKLLRDAKKHADIIVIGLDNDHSISLSKGKNRPINTLKIRCTIISELKLTDFVFPIEMVFQFSTEAAEKAPR